MALDWGYSKHNGPETWPSKFPEAAGRKQSPVDIKSCDIVEESAKNNKLQWKYIPENTESITNPGYCWKVHVNGEGSELTGGPLGNKKYVLEQFHCHWGECNQEGSEHTINGKKFAAELHLVHWNKTNYSSFEEATKHPDGLCVLGVLIDVGKKHKEIQKIVELLPKIEYKDETVHMIAPLNPSNFLPDDTSSYYTYQGSLTTPPCSECVIWIVFKTPITASDEQVAAFRNLRRCPRNESFTHFPLEEKQLKYNFRPTLPLGEREIKEYRQ